MLLGPLHRCFSGYVLNVSIIFYVKYSPDFPVYTGLKDGRMIQNVG
jgi:hypothetical protein